MVSSEPSTLSRESTSDDGFVVIHLVGPGGAGKTTVGAALADRLGLQFVDLDNEFMSRVGDISQQIDGEGYRTYARNNVETFISIADSAPSCIIALSSGFMMYSNEIHSQYTSIRSKIATSPLTFVLLPSIDLEACVRETVRRQLTRPFVRSAAKEEVVIRERYAAYMSVPATKVETMRSVDEVVEALVGLLPPYEPLEQTPDAYLAGGARRRIR